MWKVRSLKLICEWQTEIDAKKEIIMYGVETIVNLRMKKAAMEENVAFSMFDLIIFRFISFYDRMWKW